MGSEIKWIKLLIDTFEDEKIKLIQTTMPEGDAIVIIWLRLLCQAGKCNDGGYVYLNKQTPYTNDMMAALFGKPVPVVQLAIATFERFGMIEFDGDYIWIANWERHQNVDGMERAKKLKSERQKRWRDKQKQLQPSTISSTETSRETVDETQNDALERRKEKEEIRKKIVEKIIYAEFVKMTETEYGKLVSEFGEPLTKRFIEVLNNYKGANGKTYKSDYLAIRNWVIERVMKDAQTGRNPAPAPAAGKGEWNPNKSRFAGRVNSMPEV